MSKADPLITKNFVFGWDRICSDLSATTTINVIAPSALIPGSKQNNMMSCLTYALYPLWFIVINVLSGKFLKIQYYK